MNHCIWILYYVKIILFYAVIQYIIKKVVVIYTPVNNTQNQENSRISMPLWDWLL